MVTTAAVAGLIFGYAATAAWTIGPMSEAAEYTVADDVRAEPADERGGSPFALMAVEPTETSAAPARGAVSGDTPGLYGGTSQNACDRAAMVAFLEQNADRADAFAAVESIDAAGIAEYVGGLTPVTLRTDTAVTNHGFADGMVTSLQAVLQAGTAVMVDRFGVPQVRCYCGNPLASPADTDAGIAYSGRVWSDLAADRVDVITPAHAPVDEFTLVTPTHDAIDRPAGSGGDEDAESDSGYDDGADGNGGDGSGGSGDGGGGSGGNGNGGGNNGGGNGDGGGNGGGGGGNGGDGNGLIRIGGVGVGV
ncbi:hypothetical protein GCM10017691_36550 [Pseudonocardia petroleophila]